jgi:hypothetical protein
VDYRATRLTRAEAQKETTMTPKTFEKLATDLIGFPVSVSVSNHKTETGPVVSVRVYLPVPSCDVRHDGGTAVRLQDNLSSVVRNSTVAKALDVAFEKLTAVVS